MTVVPRRSARGRVAPLVPLVALLAVGAVAWFALRTAPPSPAPAPSPQASDAGEVAALLGEAERLHASEDHERSAAAYARAAELALARGDLDAHWSARAQRGVCLKMLGRTEESRAELLPALDWAREHGKRAMEGLVLGNLARCASIDGDTRAAVEWEDALAALLAAQGPSRELVLALEQAGMAALRLDDADGAVRRLREALAHNASLPPKDDQSANLTRELAWALARRGDDEGALELWTAAETSAPGLARQALHLVELGRHDAAAQLAWEAARLYEDDPLARPGDRDDALALSLGELVRAGELGQCRQRLDALFAAGSGAVAEAPFRLVEGRLELAAGRPAQAAAALARAGEGFGDDARAALARWLLAVALVEDARPDEALAVLADDDGLAAACVRGLLWSVEPPADRLAAEALPQLAARPSEEDGEHLALLRAQCPARLPTPAFLALHLGLRDADRLRGAGQEALAESTVREAVVSALLWTAREQQRALVGRWPSVEHEQALAARVRAWTRGELGEREAVAAVVPGARESYLALCTRALGATTFGLPPGAVLHEKAVATAEALRQNDLGRVLDASLDLGRTLFGLRAQVDLDHVDEILCVWPEELTGVPPAMLVLEPPDAERPAPFLVGRRTVALASLVELDDGARSDAPLARVGGPEVDLSRSRLALPEIAAHFGSAALQPAAPTPRPDDASSLLAVGARADASALRALGPARALELLVPAFGGDRFGGLVLALDDDAPFGDERAGFLPWARVPELALPRLVVLGGSRFDPRDAEHGPLRAADALALGGAREALLTRWPLAPDVRDAVTAAVLDVPQAPRDSLVGEAARRLAAWQREHLDAAGRDGAALHPRRWASWLAFATPRALP